MAAKPSLIKYLSKYIFCTPLPLPLLPAAIFPAKLGRLVWCFLSHFAKMEWKCVSFAQEERKGERHRQKCRLTNAVQCLSDNMTPLGNGKYDIYIYMMSYYPLGTVFSQYQHARSPFFVRMQWGPGRSSKGKTREAAEGGISVEGNSQATNQPKTEEFYICEWNTTISPLSSSRALPGTRATQLIMLRKLLRWQTLGDARY